MSEAAHAAHLAFNPLISRGIIRFQLTVKALQDLQGGIPRASPEIPKEDDRLSTAPHKTVSIMLPPKGVSIGHDLRDGFGSPFELIGFLIPIFDILIELIA
jgi:hypothetical protein